jgi:uncharacterized protein (TIGR03000 family)
MKRKGFGQCAVPILVAIGLLACWATPTSAQRTGGPSNWGQAARNSYAPPVIYYSPFSNGAVPLAADSSGQASRSYYPASALENGLIAASSVEPQTTSADPATAVVQVRVPAKAEVWIQGGKTNQTGAVRTFVSPPLEVRKAYLYDVRVRWTDANGLLVDVTRQVAVQPGRQTVVRVGND